MNELNSTLETPTFLVIDDDPMMRLLLRETLESSHYKVVEADSGEEGLNIFFNTNPNLVILDVVLPEMDGFSVCREIRQSSIGRDKPVVMVTGSDDLNAINQAYDSGATDFITKPINWRVLTQRLRYLLRVNALFIELAKNERLLNYAQRIAQLGNWEWDLRTNLFNFSTQARDIFSLDTKNNVGIDELVSAIHPQDRARFESRLQGACNGIEFSAESRLAGEQHGERVINQMAEVQKDEKGVVTHVLCTVQDISERKKAEEKIRYLAYYDSLTGLANRNLFKEHVRQALHGAERRHSLCAIMYLDLDNFKHINDTLGHDGGDELVKQFAVRLKSCVRQTDCASRHSLSVDGHSMSRIGGDEFTVLLSDLTSSEQAQIVANRVLDVLVTPFHISGESIKVTTSIGVSFYPDDGHSLDMLIKNADRAMYHAKHSGKNCCVYFRDMVVDEVEVTAIPTCDIPSFLNKNAALNYQAIINIGTQNVESMVVLLDYGHSGDTLINQALSLSAQDSEGVLIAISRWTLTTACLRYVQCQENTRVLPNMAICINSIAYICDNLLEDLQLALTQGFDLSKLELEINEKLLLDSAELISNKLIDIKALGVGLVIDDFGLHYAAINLLHKLPIDKIKVSRTITSNTGVDKAGNDFVTAIITMANKLNVDVVVTGVDTQDQLEFLSTTACKGVQGDYLCPSTKNPVFELGVRHNST